MTIRADGRWSGRLTSRPLPFEDPSIDALTPKARAELAQHWLSRAASEQRVGDAFAIVRDALHDVGAAHELVELATRSVDDEARHCEISRLVASRFAGHELALPPPLPLVVPAHASASPALRHTLHVVGHCALNETFASSVLEASLGATTGVLAKAALRELLSDEIDHARLGWAHLGSLDAETRAALGPWLLTLVRANLRSWRSTERDYPSDDTLVSQGALSISLLERALQTALQNLIVPGFVHLGLNVTELVRWVEAGAPTDASSAPSPEA